MKQSEEGWHGVGDKQVCPNCISEPEVAEFVRDHAIEHACSYCGHEADTPIAADVDQVFSFIAAGIRREYEDPVHHVGYDSREGGYLLDTIYTSDILEEEGFSDSHEEFWNDLCRAFSDSMWVQKDPYALSPSEEYITIWDYFCRQVRHETRFLFLQVQSSLSEVVGCGFEGEPHIILGALGRLVERLNLIVTLPTGSRLARARQHNEAQTPKTLGEIAPLPPELSRQQNRFSPAGISMFYACDETETAKLEIWDASNTEKTLLSVGWFLTQKELRLLDLTALPDFPSLFCEERAHLRAPLIFLKYFTADARRPIEKDASAIDYVPTQIVAEYFRHVFNRGCSTQRLDGIKYLSSRPGEGICYVLFFGPTDCSSCDDAKPLKLVNIETAECAC